MNKASYYHISYTENYQHHQNNFALFDRLNPDIHTPILHPFLHHIGSFGQIRHIYLLVYISYYR
jgi:hypothetical protein